MWAGAGCGLLEQPLEGAAQSLGARVAEPDHATSPLGDCNNRS